MELFGTDGVRGKAGRKVSAINAMRLAMATGIYFKEYSRTKKYWWVKILDAVGI